jgi:hypothetical protein
LNPKNEKNADLSELSIPLRLQISSSDEEIWRCVITGCRGRITTIGDRLITANTTHKHVVEPAEVEAYDILSQIRQRALMTNEFGK